MSILIYPSYFFTETPLSEIFYVSFQQNNSKPKRRNTTKEKIKTSVQADEKAVKYKKSSYFKIKLQDKNKTLLKNVKLKVTVKSGNKIKVFNIKTNSKGIAQFNTKGLKVGKYSVNITADDDNYTMTKTSKIFVGKTILSPCSLFKD